MAKEVPIDILLRMKDRVSKHMGRALRTITRGINRVRRAVFSLKGGLAVVGLALVTRSFIAAADAAEQYRIRLEVLLGSQEKANELFLAMADYAAAVPFQFENVMNAATQLAGVMKGGIKEIQRWLPLIGDLAAVSGLGIEETTSQVRRMYSAGAAAADRFRELGISSMLGFQAGVKYTAEQTRQMLMDAWTDPESKFRGATARLATSWRGLMSMMGDRWFQFRTAVMASGPFEAMKTGMQEILDKLQDWEKDGSLKRWARSTAEVIVESFQVAAEVIGAIIKSFHMVRFITADIAMTKAQAAADAAQARLDEIAARVEALAAIEPGERFQEPQTGVLGLFNFTKFTDFSGAQKEIEGMRAEQEGLTEEIKGYTASIMESWEQQLESEKAIARVNSLKGAVVSKLEEIKTARAPDRERIPEGQGNLALPPDLARREFEITQTAAEGQGNLALSADLSKFAAQRELQSRQLKAFEEFHAKQKEIASGSAAEQILLGGKALQDQLDNRNQLTMLLSEGSQARADMEIENLETTAAAMRRVFIEEIEITKWKAEEIEKINARQGVSLKSALNSGFSQTKSLIGDYAAFFQQVHRDSEGENKKAFERYKAFSKAETVIATAEGAMKAFTSFADIPVVGVGLGLAAAAAVVAMGGAKYAMIEQQQPIALAEGGIINRPTYIAGEAGESEVVLPLSRLPGMVGKIAGGGGSTTNHISIENNIPIQGGLDAKTAAILTTMVSAAAQKAVADAMKMSKQKGRY